MTYLYANRNVGIWTIRLGKFVFQLKASWYRPLFSERYGYKKHFKLGFGWRWAAFKIRQR